jgi:cellulose synthase (UDP-forming)
MSGLGRAAFSDSDDMARDPRYRPVTWNPGIAADRTRRLARLMVLVNIPLAIWYFGWLLQPDRIGNEVLYAVLIAAEILNLVGAAGFWWTCAHARARTRAAADSRLRVDVLIPVYNEPLDVVEPTVAAAARMRGARVRVTLLDDGHRDELGAMARKHGARYLRRPNRTGAKAGNLNYALAHTSAPFVAVFDCDHVPLSEAAWAQQALFFGAIAMGKDGTGSIFCCGTNVVFRRAALDRVGGFPEGSLTEDFELSVHLHAAGWRSVYLPEVLARGLGPEDMASYVSQQQRWARGCLAAIPTVLRARLPWRLKTQYLLSSLYFLSGWSIAVYMMLPVVRMLTGAQPLAGVSADQFLIHFAPYFSACLITVAVAGGGVYTFAAFALAVASFWIHIQATILDLLRRRGSFVVTAKHGSLERQPRVVWPALAAIVVLAGTSIARVSVDQSPGMLNNAAFAALHVVVLLAGIWPALVIAEPRSRDRPEAHPEPPALTTPRPAPML